MAIAILTPLVAPYRRPLYQRLAERYDIEVLCYGGGERYVPPWFAGFDRDFSELRFPARRLTGVRAAAALGKRFEIVVAPVGGGAVLPAAYGGTKLRRRTFILWASVWAQPRSLSHAAALPATRHIYRHADAVLAYGEHVRRHVAQIRGRDNDVFVVTQAVEPELFGRRIDDSEVDSFRERHGLGEGRLVLYVGRLTAAKGIDVLLEAWPRVKSDATLLMIGDGPLAERCRSLPGTSVIGTLARPDLPVAYAASEFALVPSIPTPRFKEPWGLVCNEALHQSTPVIASDAVGAVAGGLVRDGETGLVVPAGDPDRLARVTTQLLADDRLRSQLGARGKTEVAAYNYDAAVDGFEQALAAANGETATHWPIEKSASRSWRE
jgi:glycosyltransferase involved in cell wall biosynthesis